MANAKLTRDVKVLSTPGFARNAGRAIGQGEVSPAIWNMWIAEGIVVYDSGTPPTRPEQTIIEDSLPQESTAKIPPMKTMLLRTPLESIFLVLSDNLSDFES